MTISKWHMTGTLPLSWGSKGAFPALTDLDLEGLSLSGTLPAGYGSLTAFQQLQTLVIYNCNITGMLVSGFDLISMFHCSQPNSHQSQTLAIYNCNHTHVTVCCHSHWLGLVLELPFMGFAKLYLRGLNCKMCCMLYCSQSRIQ